VDGIGVQIASSSASLLAVPTVTAATDCFLVTWKERLPGATTDRLFARRYAFDGSPLDAQPLLLISEVAIYRVFPYVPYPEIPEMAGVASDGNAFLVIDAVAADTMRIIRVDARSGAVGSIDHRVPEEWVHGIRFVQILPLPGRWLVLFARMNDSGVDYRAAVEVFPSLGSTRDALLLWELPTYVRSGLAFARAVPDRISFMSSGCVDGQGCGPVFVQATLQQWVLSVKRLDRSYGPVVWNGSEYVLLSTNQNERGTFTLQGIRMGRDSGLLDSVPFDITTDDVVLGSLAMAVTPDGVLIAYSKVDGTGVPRVYARELQRLLPEIPRRRSAGH